MDYYQGVVTGFLRADRAVFVNTECCIQLHPGANPDVGMHWYCDAVAINMRERQVFLCEITYSKSLDALVKRLNGWCANWSVRRLGLSVTCAYQLTGRSPPGCSFRRSVRVCSNASLPDLLNRRATCRTRCQSRKLRISSESPHGTTMHGTGSRNRHGTPHIRVRGA